MVKSSNTERAMRINAALSLIKKHDTVAEAVAVMMDLYAISRRQAYRYVQEAQRVGTSIPIPEPKIAFTIKLSPKLIQAIRDHAKVSGRNLSEIVTQALEKFLYKGRRRG
jgi:predicted DNA-binding transcriptional regulator YafY